MTKSLKLGLVFLFLFQIIIAASFDLAHDEAYYWLFSRSLDWGYFDHPPFVAWVIALFSFLPHHELSVRIGFILLQFGTLFFLFRMTDKQVWWQILLLFFAFPLASYAGLLALPDMPLLFMTAAYFYFLGKFLNGDRPSTWILAIVIPLLLYAKYHGILLVFFTIVAIPKLLTRKEFWLIAIVSLILFFPHLWWQKEHDFMTLRYHFLERPSSSFSFSRILDYLGTQLVLSGLLCGPALWWLLIKKKPTDDYERVLKVTSVGLLLFFLVSTFSKKVEANWTISLVIPMVVFVGQSSFWTKKYPRLILLFSFTVVLLARLAFVLPGLPIKRVAEFHGWKVWSEVVREKCGEKAILANSYQIASKLSFYLNQEVSALNYRSRKNQFDLWNRIPQGEVCYVTDKQEFQGEPVASPENKKFLIVTTLTGRNLMEMKTEDIDRKRDKP